MGSVSSSDLCEYKVCTFLDEMNVKFKPLSRGTDRDALHVHNTSNQPCVFSRCITSSNLATKALQSALFANCTQQHTHHSCIQLT